MVRKGSKTATPYTHLTADEVSAVILATEGHIKAKQVDPRKIVGTIHIKKYLADAKINGKVETWISILKKLTAPVEEDQAAPELTHDEIEALEDCKAETKKYLDEDASAALKQKVASSTEEYKNLKDVASSMKFKFSRYAYEAVTHVINLMVREVLVFTCDNCASQKNKLTKPSHIPWGSLQTKLLAGLYMNTHAVFDAVHPVDHPEVETTEAAESVEGSTADDAAEAAVPSEDDVSDDEAAPEKSTKPRLSQYISNTFKEIVSRDERFKGLLLGKDLTALLNSIIYQVLDRYAKIIKSLLQTANSKTVNERLAVIATKILLQDHVHAQDADVAVVLDLVQARLEELKEQPETADETADAPAVETPVAVETPATEAAVDAVKKTVKPRKSK